MSPDSLSSLCAVITTYRPDDQFGERFAGIAASCRAIIVVDNTPGGHQFGADTAGFIILQDGCNKGLGKALNMGIDRARELGGESVVLFDQDSTPDLRLLGGLHVAMADATTCVGPTLLDDQDTKAQETLARARSESGPLQKVTCLATSGMMFSIVGWRDMPRFSEEFFLDFVDFDWCWRMGRLGWSFFKSREFCMLHRLGLSQRRLLGLTFHVPAPYRHYFQFRDTLRLVTRRYVPLYSKFRLSALLPLKLLGYPWILDRGLERARWMLLGILDALRSRGGAGAAKVRLGA